MSEKNEQQNSQPKNQPNIWIFQARPERYNLSVELEPGKQQAWEVNQYKNDIENGDIVYLYQSGEAAGFYGWGEISGEVYDINKESPIPKASQFKNSESAGIAETGFEITTQSMINIDYKVKFLEFIPRWMLEKHEVWKKHQLLAAGTGTNFKLSQELAKLLNEDIIGSSSTPPILTKEIKTSQMFPYLSPASRQVLSRAAGIRKDMGGGKIAIEDLLLGLWDESSILPALADSKFDNKPIDRKLLFKQIISYTSTYPETYTPQEINRVPELSENVDLAFKAAYSKSREDRSMVIRPRHFLQGLMADTSSKASEILGKLSPLPQLDKLPSAKLELKNKALSDAWSMADQLGYRKLADAISIPILEGVTRPPLTVGIQAPWGQGKTTLMRMIRHRLDPRSERDDLVTEIKKIWQEILTFKKDLLHGLEEIFKDTIKNHMDKFSCSQLHMDTLRSMLNTLEDLRDGLPYPPTPPNWRPWEGDGEEKGEITEENSTYNHLESWFDKDRENIKGMLVREIHQTGKLVIPSVWFNPLYYQEKDQVWAGLAHAILHQLSNRLDSRLKREEFWFKLRTKRLNKDAVRRDFHRMIFEKLLPKAAAWLGFGIITFVSLLLALPGSAPWWTKLTFGWGPAIGAGAIHLLSLFKNAKKKWSLEGKFQAYIQEPDYESKLGYLRLVDEDIDRALELLTGGGPIAIFIDDLDRCSPQTLSDIILAINQFISVRDRNVFFFLAMDSQKVAKILEESESFQGKLKSENNGSGVKSFGWHFLEKFINLPFFIPGVNETTAHRYMQSLLETAPSGEEGTGREASGEVNVASIEDPIQATRAMEEAQKRGDARAEEKIMQQVSRMLADPEGDEMKKLAAQLTADIEPNPRVMKRCLGLVRLLRGVQIGFGKGEREDNPRLMVVRAAQLVVNWPQLIIWIKEKRLDAAQLEKWTKESMDLQENRLQEWAGKFESLSPEIKTVVACQGFHDFMIKLTRTRPGLKEIFESGLF